MISSEHFWFLLYHSSEKGLMYWGKFSKIVRVRVVCPTYSYISTSQLFRSIFKPNLTCLLLSVRWWQRAHLHVETPCMWSTPIMTCVITWSFSDYRIPNNFSTLIPQYVCIVWPKRCDTISSYFISASYLKRPHKIQHFFSFWIKAVHKIKNNHLTMIY